MSSVSIANRCGAWGRRLAARGLVKRALDLHVVGLEHVPRRGPAILAARHYHHLYDTAAILACVPRDVHVLVALDWLTNHHSLCVMRQLTAAARWPAVWRSGPHWRLNRGGYRLSLELLEEGQVLLVFPEGYPTIDPRGARKKGPADFLPFDPGFLTLASRAARDVPIVPVGLSYASRPHRGWTVWLRFGRPLFSAHGGSDQRRDLAALVEREVQGLSAAPAGV